jgi:hypothetical protein
VERSDNGVHDAFHVPHYVGVPHAQNTKALLLEIALAPRIPPQLLIRAVRSAIDLHNQPLGQAREVNDKMIDRHLLAELEPDLLQLAQLPPQPPFGLGSVPA